MSDFDPSKWVLACAICGEHITSFEMCVTHTHVLDDVVAEGEVKP